MISGTEFAASLSLAVGLGAAIGLEREWRGHDAGIKTNALVSGGAAVFMMLSVLYGDGARIAAQVVTGIGFLGAGNIMRSGDRVKGLTTAATLWVVAGVGMVVGSGHYRHALIATAAVLMVNLIIVPLESQLDRLRAKKDQNANPEAMDGSVSKT